MQGNRAGERNCHIRPDLVLIYSKPNSTYLNLIRLASHSELFNWGTTNRQPDSNGTGTANQFCNHLIGNAALDGAGWILIEWG